jgi:hypothetical protein
MSRHDRIVIDKEAVFSSREPDQEYMNLREELYGKFVRKITSLLESKRPRTFNSHKGLLNPRRLYRHSYDDQVFNRKTQIPNSDTTFLFLIDNSGSMAGGDLDTCNAIVSAFAKANKTVLGNRIKMEVFAKSTAGDIMKGFVKGYVPSLTRIYSNVVGKQDWDKIMYLGTTAPMRHVGKDGIRSKGIGSYTPEYLLLPALREWMKKNITTKNVVVINLTDGSVQHSFYSKSAFDGSDTETRHVRSCGYATDEDTKTLRIKYLRDIPNTTLFIGARKWDMEKLDDMYGDCIHIEPGDDFSGEFFKILFRLVNEYA